MSPYPAFARAAAAALLGMFAGAGHAAAQFRDDFDGQAPVGWAVLTGDGLATGELRLANGKGILAIDATRDRDNIWWVLIKRNVAPLLDLKRLARPGHEVRVEVRVRVREAPRRVHTQVNTQRTTDFHLNLREYDLPDTLWHIIASTTRGLDYRPGDDVNVQLALTDAGLGHPVVEVDWYRADVVEAGRAPPDVGEPVRYQPPPAHADPAAYEQHLAAAAAAVIDERFPELNFAKWHEEDDAARAPVLAVSASRYAILRWDLARFAGRRARGHGVLELTTSGLQLGPDDPEEYGQVRVIEILGGDPHWERSTVTFRQLTGGQPLDTVANPQILIDSRVGAGRGPHTRITISRTVLQRMIDGRTLGLLLAHLGPMQASFYATGAEGPRLHLDLEPDPGKAVP